MKKLSALVSCLIAFSSAQATAQFGEFTFKAKSWEEVKFQAGFSQNVFESGCARVVFELPRTMTVQYANGVDGGQCKILFREPTTVELSLEIDSSEACVVEIRELATDKKALLHFNCIGT